MKALGGPPLWGVGEQREVLVNGIGHGRTTRDDVGVIKAVALSYANDKEDDPETKADYVVFLQYLQMTESDVLPEGGASIEAQAV